MSAAPFTRDSVARVHAELLTALRPVAMRLGLSIEAAGGKYSDVEFTPRFRVTHRGDEGGDMAAEFRRYATSLRLEATDLGARFSNDGHAYTIIGAKVGTKRPIVCKRAGDRAERTWNFTVDAVRRALGRPA